MTVALAGTYNFRDVGGMALVGGGTTATGVLYRSDALNALTQEGLAALAASDIGVIADFRTPMERAGAPDLLPTNRPFRVVDLPLLEGALPSAPPSAAPAGAVAAPPSAEAIQAMIAQLPSLSGLYLNMLQSGASEFAEFARLVSAATVDPPTAVIVHCTAGKDRTGVSTALVLDAVGVERAAIIADYSSSQANLAGPWADKMFAMVESFGVPLTDQLREIIAGTPATAIEQALAWVDAHGGSGAYLQSGGLSSDELEALRARLRA